MHDGKVGRPLSHVESVETGLGRMEFLTRLDMLLPWNRLEALIGPRRCGGYPPELMLRVYLLPCLYGLSDEGVREAVIDSRAFSAFCRATSLARVPDVASIGEFRDRLTLSGTRERVLELIAKDLTERGLTIGRDFMASAPWKAPSPAASAPRRRATGASEARHEGRGSIRIRGPRSSSAKVRSRPGSRLTP